jgi:hypothetical protein
VLALAGCGVKGDPTPPGGAPLPSLLENYPDVETQKPLNEFEKRRR